MLDFDEFKKALGDEADQYTPAELRQLHVETDQMARILWAMIQAERRSKRATSGTAFPQSDLDAVPDDRTVEATPLTPRDDDLSSSTDPP